MGRFVSETFTTGSVAGSGGILDYEHTVLSNLLDIAKIKVVPSSGSGTNVVSIYKTAARGVSDLVYTTKAWTGSLMVDPGDSAAAEGTYGWVFPYYDVDEGLQLHFRFTNNDASAKTYTVTVEYEYLATDNPGVIGAPELVFAQATANGLKVTSGVVSQRNNATIDEAEFRAIRKDPGDPFFPQDLRLASEGGTFVPDGINKLSVTGIVAGPGGAQYIFTSAAAGKWYFVWRLHNSVGWSRWSDGNVTPSIVRQWVNTQTTSDTGPPADWEVWIEEGPYVGTVVVHATRPRTNGQNLLWWAIQIKDADSGSWIALDDGAAPSEVKYDGSAIAHTLEDDSLKISKASGTYGTAIPGDLILMDVRGGNFDVNFCQWGIVQTISGTDLIFDSPGWRPQVLTDLRIKIVKPPWTWTGNGYLGDQSNQGFWGGGSENFGLGVGWINGSPLQEFVSDAISLPTTVTNPQARVWFENTYARSNGGITSSGLTGGTGQFAAPVTFNNFNDRNTWLPIYPPGTWGTLTFQSDGSVIMACSGYQNKHYGQAGIRARWRPYIDANAQLILYAKFIDVILPVGTAADDELSLGIVLMGSANGAWDYFTSGVALTNKGTTAPQVRLDNPYIDFRVNVAAAGIYDNVAYVASPNFNRPAALSIIELRVTIQKDTVTGSYGVTSDSVAARVGGSGAYTSVHPSFGREGVTIGTGIEVFVGLIGNCRLATATATLTEFQMINGIGEYY